MCFDLSSSSFSKCTATMSKKGEKGRIKLTVLVVFFSFFFTLILQENSSGFFFKLPRFHQLLAVYIITLKKVIWFFPPEERQLLLCLWSPELPRLLCDSGCLFSQESKGKLVRGGSEDHALRWDWTGLLKRKWEGRASTHNIYKYIFPLSPPLH